MGSAYTPGLTVNEDTIISKTRRLPLKGAVLVEKGQTVTPDTVVARADLPGIMHSVKVAAILGCDPEDVPHSLLVQIGDSVEKGQIIARTTGLWGLFKSEAKATTTGSIEMVSPITGNVGIREIPTPIEVSAYIPGVITEILPGEGVTITTQGALIQGIFGVGGERRAPLHCVSVAPTDTLTEAEITPDLAGKAIVGGANITGAGLKKAAQSGIVGVIVGGIVDTDLVDFLGYDIGVAITGHEDIPLTLVLTEGFGTIAMAERTFALLQSRNGQYASFSGATQIRAGVIRPEIIIEGRATPSPDGTSTQPPNTSSSLDIGTSIRIIREPHFGLLATVTALPPELVRVESGAEVRVLEARLPSGETVIVPRANVELIL
jgi:hypothetical protein